MANKINPRLVARSSGLTKKIPGKKSKPAGSVNDFNAAAKIVSNLPALSFPINSASEFLHQLGGTNARIAVLGRRFDPGRMIRYLPAYYFPIASKDNMVEKIAEVVKQMRTRRARLQRQFNTVKTSLKSQVPDLKFPIASADDFMKMIHQNHHFTFRGQHIDPKQAVHRIPTSYFPIMSEADFDRKMFSLLVRQSR